MPRNAQPAQPLHVYGDVGRFHRYLRQSQQRGSDLLDEAEGIRVRLMELRKVKNGTERLARRSLVEFAVDCVWSDMRTGGAATWSARFTETSHSGSRRGAGILRAAPETRHHGPACFC